MGKKTQQKFLCIRCIKDNPKNRCSPPSVLSLSLSPMRYTSESLCVQIRITTPLLIHNELTDFYPNQVGPTKQSGSTSPRKTQNSILYYSLWCY